ncbi:glycoside hydrolase family 18 protein [Desarmillaria tabescens]|uniref:chitinase n=1 Tax=Armillaria tabescens TaxID=1929756 RepID=A0AA39NK08_ARMTA|nr:glycoside hydrolase family 18 protein [Desarmillaria tabescens]KAK0467058.1 glycoside hydrolase family 18 protein [Desarmillaria tabescens]
MVCSLTATLISALIFSYLVRASPVNLTVFDGKAREILERSTPAPPHWVIYSDTGTSTTGPPDVSDIDGFTVFSLSFLLMAGAWDKAYEWTTLTDDERTDIKSQYATAGVKLLVSVFGSSDVPTTSRADPIATADTMAAWVKQYNLDGIDVDYEDFTAFDAGDGKAEQWLADFTTQLRVTLPKDSYILTHAPVAPWFSPTHYGGGGYLKVHEMVGDMIDWYNVQFYNQGTDEYTTCDGLLNTSSDTWNGTALFQIADNGVDLSKLVIGKPATASDASNGYMDPDTLATCLATAKDRGWDGGAMVWQYPHGDESWINTVRAKSWPV